MGVKSPDKVDVEVGARIRELRTTAGLSQTALAEQLGVTFQQVQKYEKGANRVSSGRLTRIAEFLQVPVTTLLGVDEEQGNRGKGARQAASPLQLVHVSESDDPISPWTANIGLSLECTQANGVRTFTGLY
jgi:transcriptional regulator with XRE-family HTH domain